MEEGKVYLKNSKGYNLWYHNTFGTIVLWQNINRCPQCCQNLFQKKNTLRRTGQTRATELLQRVTLISMWQSTSCFFDVPDVSRWIILYCKTTLYRTWSSASQKTNYAADYVAELFEKCKTIPTVLLNGINWKQARMLNLKDHQAVKRGKETNRKQNHRQEREKPHLFLPEQILFIKQTLSFVHNVKHQLVSVFFLTTRLAASKAFHCFKGHSYCDLSSVQCRVKAARGLSCHCSTACN